MTDFWMTPPPTTHNNQLNDVHHPSSRYAMTMTTTTTTTCLTPFEHRFVCSVVKFSDAFFPLVKSQCVIFTVSQMFFSG